MKTATFVKRMTKGFVGIAELYKCEPPMEEIDYDYDIPRALENAGYTVIKEQ